jgi:hypothetical protein
MNYDAQRIAQELDQTAQGYSYYGNALYVAMGMPGVTDDERRMLHRYMNGSELTTDRLRLQELAIKLRDGAERTS